MLFKYTHVFVAQLASNSIIVEACRVVHISKAVLCIVFDDVDKTGKHMLVAHDVCGLTT